MILITGDTHGIYDYHKIDELSKKNILSKDDYLIISGDFGAIWSEKTLEYYLSFYTKLNFNVLFVDGNHENFDMLNAYPVTTWNGGKVHKIAENVIHLMRGQIYTIENKTIFTFGGGTSIDKYQRIENISWWEDEIPNEQEVEEAKENLKKHNNKVDYIITHSIDSKTLKEELYWKGVIKLWFFEDNYILDWFEENVEYKHWYFGHYHLDAKLKNKTCLYNDIIEIK